jgi:hypothetical protein
MSEKKLGRHVTVAGTTSGPGDDVPADVREKITNPKAWLPADAAENVDEHEGKEGGTAGGHKLAASVTVGGRTYTPTDFLPDDVAAQIRNPKAWAGGKLPTQKAAKAADIPAPAPAGDGGDKPAKAATAKR